MKVFLQFTDTENEDRNKLLTNLEKFKLIFQDAISVLLFFSEVKPLSDSSALISHIGHKPEVAFIVQRS